MRRVLTASLVAVLLSAPLNAQTGQRLRLPEQPPSIKPLERAPAKQPQPVPIQKKLRYICKQLDLDERQSQHAEGLFAVLEVEAEMTPEQTREHLELIMSTYQDMKAAEEAGDQERAEAIREQLRGLAPGVAAERNFVNGLMPVLNEQQQAQLQRLLQQLKNATDLALKPIQVVRLARGLKLTAEQQAELEQIQQRFRGAISAAGSEAQQNELLDKLISDIAAILDAQQRAEFEREIEKRRPDEPPPPAEGETAAPAPATQPRAAP